MDPRRRGTGRADATSSGRAGVGTREDIPRRRGDDDLLELARDGDRDAFAIWWHRTGRNCRRTATGCSGRAGCRGRVAGDAARGVAGPGGFRRPLVGAHLAVPGGDQPLPQQCCAPRAAGRWRRAVAGAAPQPTRYGEVSWLQPYPDDLLDELSDQAPGPEARYESREAISLAFVTAVQLLPPTSVPCCCCATSSASAPAKPRELLGLSEDAVTSALKRARASMAGIEGRTPPPAAGSAEEHELTERFVAAFTALDIDAIVALMTDDAWVKMPPLPSSTTVGTPGAVPPRDPRTSGADRRMVPVRANRHPAWGAYVREPAPGSPAQRTDHDGRDR